MQETNPFINWTRRHFALLFWALFLLMLIPVTRMLGHKKYLENTIAPNGIISLELAHSDLHAKAIAMSWFSDTHDVKIISECSCNTDKYVNRSKEDVAKNTIEKLQIARDDVYTDFFFILLYVLFTALIIARLEGGSKWLTLWLCLPLIEGLCDCIENIGMLGYLHHPSVTPAVFPEPYYSIASEIKFCILFFLVLIYLPVRLCINGALRSLSDYVSAKTNQLWRYRVIVIGIVFFALPLWLSDQGQDLLININEKDRGVLLFLFTITVMAALTWWLAKLFFEDQYTGPALPYIEPGVNDPTKLRIEKKASRFFGVMTFLFPAFAILQALSAFKIAYPVDGIKPILWLLLLSTAFYVVIKRDLVTLLYARIPAPIRVRYGLTGLILVMLLLLFALPIWFRFYWTVHSFQNKLSPESLTYVSLDLVLMSTAFILFVSLRDEVIPAGWQWLRSKIGIPIYLVSFALAILFLYVNIRPVDFSLSFEGNYICIPILFSGLIFYILFFTWLIRISKKWSINITLFFLLLCTFINIVRNNKFHDVRFQPLTNDSVYARNTAIEEYFYRWLMHRKDEIDRYPNNKKYPIFLVNAYGGGIRAAAFTSLVIQQLNDSAPKWQAGSQPFEHFVFSYSGASGGTIGAAVMCAYRYAMLTSDSTGQMNDRSLKEFYNKDFLTPVISGMIGRDIWAACGGLSCWWDRSAVQESLWERRIKNQWKADFSHDYYEYWDTMNKKSRFEIPLLFANSCNVDDGLKGIMSPLHLDHKQFPSTDFIADQVPEGKMISFSTAAFLSARFPWISPTGKTNPNFHFIDGGVKENSGAETSQNIYLALQKLYNDSSGTESAYPGLYHYLKKTAIYFISISNSSHSLSGPEKKVANLFQLTSPLIALYNSGVNGNAMESDSALRFRYADLYASIWPDVDCIRLTKGECTKFSPGLPLGWQISQSALFRLEASAFKSDYYGSVADTIPGFGKIKRFMSVGQ